MDFDALDIEPEVRPLILADNALRMPDLAGEAGAAVPRSGPRAGAGASVPLARATFSRVRRFRSRIWFSLDSRAGWSLRRGVPGRAGHGARRAAPQRMGLRDGAGTAL